MTQALFPVRAPSRRSSWRGTLRSPSSVRGVAALLAGMLLLAGCGGGAAEPAATTTTEEPAAGTEAAGGDTSELTPVELQLAWIKSMQFAGPFMAQELGAYADQGLDVELLGGGPSVDAITVVASGAAMVGLADSNEIAVARGQGIPVVALGAAFQKSPFGMITLEDSPVTTLEGQYGKTVAVSDSSRPTLEALMEREGLDPAEVNFVPKNPDPSVLVDEQVDVYWGFVTSEAATLQARDVAVDWTLMADLGEPTYANTYFTTEENLEADRDAIVALMAADLLGWQYAVDNPDETAQVVNATYQSEDEELDVMQAQGDAQIELITAGDELLTIDPEVFSANIESAVNGGLIDEAYPVGDVIDTSVLEDARATLEGGT